MAVCLALDICSFVSGITVKKTSKPVHTEYKVRPRCSAQMLPQAAATRRRALVCSASVAILALSCSLAPSQTQAEDKANGQDEKDEGAIGAIKSLFDPNEKTKSGKVLPKTYLKTAREVVKNLRESLKEDSSDIAKFRRTADAAKESIKEYLGSWKGKENVVHEESYVELEKAIRTLASFYSKAGPSAPLPEDVKTQILSDLDTAEEFL